MTTRSRRRRRNRTRHSVAGRRARILALQSLYTYDIGGASGSASPEGDRLDPEALLDWLCAEEPAPPAIRRAAAAITAGVIAAAPGLDAAIRRYAPAFPVNLLAIVDRNILRMAIYELTSRAQEVPRAVVVNEAVELAAIYGSESSARFVNGVLGSAVSDLPAASADADVNAGADADETAAADADATINPGAGSSQSQ